VLHARKVAQIASDWLSRKLTQPLAKGSCSATGMGIDTSVFARVPSIVLLVHRRGCSARVDSGSQIDLRWEQVRLVRDRWPRVDTFFHRLTCEGIKIPHPRFYRHRGMSRGMFHPAGKSAVMANAWKEQCIVWCRRRA